MPARSALADRVSTSPRPPPTASTVSPPQKRNRPSILNAWLWYMGTNRTPLDRIHSAVVRLRVTRTSVRSGSHRDSVTRAMSS